MSRVRRLGGRLAAAVRRHPLFSALFAVGLVVRVLVLVAYQPALEFYDDSFTYLANAAHLVPRTDRPIAYPLVLRALSYTHTLMAVPAVQHVAGLGIAVAVYLLLLRLGVNHWLAALGAAPMLLDGYQIDIEQFVMAETLFEGLVVAALWLLVGRRRPGTRACVLAGGVLALAALTRTLGLELAVPALAFLALRRVGWRRIGAFLLALVLPLVAYAGWLDAAHGQFGISGYDGLFLYGRVAQIARCPVDHPTPAERGLCEASAPAARPGPNYYDWDAAAPRFALADPQKQATLNMLGDFARRVIEHQPVAYLQMVAGDVVHYFAPTRFAGPRDWYLQTWQFPDPTNLDYQLVWHVTVARQGYFARRVHPTTVHALVPFLRAYQSVLYTPGPLLAAGLLLGLVGGLAGRRGDGHRRLVAVLLAVLGLGILVAPAATADFDYRYALPALPVLPPAGALGLSVLAARRRGAGPPPAPAEQAVPATQPERAARTAARWTLRAPSHRRRAALPAPPPQR